MLEWPNIEHIKVEPVNAIIGFTNWNPPNTYDPIGFSSFYLYEVDIVGVSQDWNGSVGFVIPALFPDSGLIQLKITIYNSPAHLNYAQYNGIAASIDTLLLII